MTRLPGQRAEVEQTSREYERTRRGMAIETEKMLSLFRQPLSVANVGLDLFSEALQAQGIETTGIEWRPPAIDLDPDALALFHDPGIEVANQEAVGRMIRA